MRSWEQSRAERTLRSQKTGFLLLTLRSTLFCCVTLNWLLSPAEWRGTLPSTSLLVIRLFDKRTWWALQSSTYLSDVYTAQFYSHSLSCILFQLFLGYAEALSFYAIPRSFISLVIFWAAGAISGESVPMPLSCGVSHNGFRVSGFPLRPLIPLNCFWSSRETEI